MGRAVALTASDPQTDLRVTPHELFDMFGQLAEQDAKVGAAGEGGRESCARCRCGCCRCGAAGRKGADAGLHVWRGLDMGLVVGGEAAMSNGGAAWGRTPAQLHHVLLL